MKVWYKTIEVWISAGEGIRERIRGIPFLEKSFSKMTKEKSEKFCLDFPGILNAVWDFWADPRNVIEIIIIHSTNLQWAHTMCQTLEIWREGPSCHCRPARYLLPLSYCINSPWCLLFFLHPWRHCFQNYHPPKEMYLVILLLKMPQWFPIVSWVKSKFLSLALTSCLPSGPHPEPTAPPYPHLWLLTACTPPSTNASYTLSTGRGS